MFIRKQVFFNYRVNRTSTSNTAGTVAATQHISPKSEFTNILLHHLSLIYEKSDSADRFYPTPRLRISPPDVRHRIFSRMRVRRCPRDAQAFPNFPSRYRAGRYRSIRFLSDRKFTCCYALSRRRGSNLAVDPLSGL